MIVRCNRERIGYPLSGDANTSNAVCSDPPVLGSGAPTREDRATIGNVCPESSPASFDRRRFISRAVIAGAAVGVGSSVLAAPSFVAKSSASSHACGGYCNVNVDPCGHFNGHFPTRACLCNPYCFGYTLRFGEEASCSCILYIPGQGIASSQNASCPNYLGLDFYTGCCSIGSCFESRLSITHNGSVGIGTTTPQRELCVNGLIHASCGVGLGTQTTNTTLAVNGSVSAKVATIAKSYEMGSSDFAVLADASSGALLVTLPSAGTTAGRIVFIKKVDSSKNSVFLATYASGSKSDTIEGATNKTLNLPYDSIYLISSAQQNSSLGYVWAILGNSICHAFAY